MKIFLALLFLALPTQAQYAHRSNPGVPGATAPAITTAGSGNCPGTGCVALNTGGTSTLIVKIGGTWTATLSFRCSNDNWASTANQTAYPVTNGILGTGVTTTAANGTWSVPTGGYLSCGVYCDAFTSNTSMTVNLDADPANSTSGVTGVPGAAPIQVQGVTASGAAPGTENPVMMGAFDTTNMQKVQSDTSGRLKVVGAGAKGAAVTGNPVLMAGATIAGATNVEVLTVKAASVAPASTDTAAVVAISPIGDPCISNAAKSSVVINIASATTTQLVALSGSTVIYVCGFVVTNTGVTTITTAVFEYGTGSTCGTGTTALTGAMGQSLLTSAIVVVNSGATQFKTAAGNALCLLSAGTTPSIQGYVTYVQQ